MLLPSSSHSTVEDIFLLHTLTQGKEYSHDKQDYRHVPVATSILTRLPHSCSDPTKLILQMALDARHTPHRVLIKMDIHNVLSVTETGKPCPE